MRRLAFKLIVVAAFSTAVPGSLSASTFLKSSMEATCDTWECSSISFVLDIDTNVYVDWVTVSSTDIAAWKFGSMVSATDAYGNDLNWTWELREDGIYIKAGGYLAPEPIHLTMAMEVYSGEGRLYTGVLQYQGLGDTELIESDGTQYVFGGDVSVTPEPLGSLLLGSGLVGMVGIRRRRSRKTAAETG